MIDWGPFVSAAIVLALIPGPNQILSVRNAVRFGVGPATCALAGRFVVFASMAGAVAVGLGAVLTRSAFVFDIIKWVGVAYLIYLGVTMVWRARTAQAGDALDEDARSGNVGRRILLATRQEVIVAATNPKAMLLFAAFLPQFLPSAASGGTLLLLLAAAYIGIEAIAAIGYTALGGALGRLDLTARAHRTIERITGTAFVGLGGYLATAQRP